MSASQGRGVERRDGAFACHRPALSWRLLIVVAAGLVVVACRGSQTPVPAEKALPSAPATPLSTVVPGQSPRATTWPSSPARVLTLTVWGPDSMAPLSDVPGGDVFAAQIDAFTQARPGWQVRYVRKKPYGQGGIAHFLRSTAAVAPAQLPDLALVDMREVAELAGSSLLQPLEPLLDAGLMADLAPFARQAGQVGEHLVAVQYDADLRFLAYNSAVVAKPPATWAELAELHASYLLPLGASEGAVADGFLPLYLALGGRLTDRSGQPYLDETVASAVLEAYDLARQAGSLAPSGLEIDTATDCWPIYLASAGKGAEGEVAMANVTSWDYGRERSHLASTGIAALPTLSGEPATMANGWGWVLITRDPERQAAALAFLRALFDPTAMAAWSKVTYHLPARLSALRLAVGDGEYRQFLEQLMLVAAPQPQEPAYSLAVAALGPAIDGVARGKLAPKAAAAEAAARMRATQK
jgi:ABC-type glycerol-3-phosphate transport system substrate-binding protein